MPEYAKELVWDNNLKLLDGSLQSQYMLYTEQKRRIDRLLGKVDFVVTDSPTVLSLCYLTEQNQNFCIEVMKNFSSNENFCIFIKRGDVFETQGRIHDLEQSRNMDSKIKATLKDNCIYFGTYEHDTVDLSIQNMIKTYHRINKEELIADNQKFPTEQTKLNKGERCQMNDELRYEVRMTSDAFPDPEDVYAIWDNRYERYHADVDGRIETFEVESKANIRCEQLLKSVEIRFIDPEYNELFRIPDSGYIVVTRPEGEIFPGTQEEWVGKCKFLDEAHTEINGECFHICQFAEIQERISSTIRPEPNPEMVGNYRVTHRTFVGDKIFKFGHNPGAVQPYATWQSYKDNPERNDWGHYWSDRNTATSDFFLRADAERTGKSYDHTTLNKPPKDKDSR